MLETTTGACRNGGAPNDRPGCPAERKMNVTIDTARFVNRYLIAGVLALALVLGPAAGMASADVDGPNHGCVEHPVGSDEYNEECNAGPAATASATASATAPATASAAPAASLPDTGGIALLPLAGAALLSIGALTAVGAFRGRRARGGDDRGAPS